MVSWCALYLSAQIFVFRERKTFFGNLHLSTIFFHDRPQSSILNLHVIMDVLYVWPLIELINTDEMRGNTAKIQCLIKE